jgi:hypothetical protein
MKAEVKSMCNMAKRDQVLWRVGIALTLVGLSAAGAQTRYGGGSGTMEDPYQIWTAEQLSALADEPNDFGQHFRLMADLDLAPYKDNSFRLIGYMFAGYDDKGRTLRGWLSFEGVFDGNGHTISNLTYTIEEPSPEDNPSNPLTDYGLFRYLGGEVRNLGLINPTIRPAATCTYDVAQVGALAGYCFSGSSIINCYVQGGQISGDDRVGGLVGHLGSPSSLPGLPSLPGHIPPVISECRASCLVSCSRAGRPIAPIPGYVFGGLVGQSYGNILRSYAQGNVEAAGAASVGGLVGNLASNCTVEACFATGSVTGGAVGFGDTGGLMGKAEANSSVHASYSTGPIYGTFAVGGLVGRAMPGATIRDCYSTGQVLGQERVAGLAGEASSLVRVECCYATGAVSGTAKSRTGGLIGYGSPPAGSSNCFWNRETSGLDTSAGGIGLTTTQMQNIQTYISAGWDFVGEIINGTDDVWKMDDGGPAYPELAWQESLPGDSVDAQRP